MLAVGVVAVSRRAGLAAASGLAIAGLATRPARAIGGAAVGLPDVVELTPDNFDKEITNSGKASFIKFLAPW